MDEVYQAGGFTPPTAAESAKSNAAILAHMEKKFILDRTPEKFKARLLAAFGSITRAATELETETQTLSRWCNDRSKIPGVAWVALGLLERTR